MEKDKRYKTVKLLIEKEGITRLEEIFEHIPVTTIALMLGTNWQRLTKYINNPLLFKFGEILVLAKYFEVGEEIMIKIVYSQIVLNRTKRKKK